jgi:YidC/Oxa1 family membrane protein insertase
VAVEPAPSGATGLAGLPAESSRRIQVRTDTVYAEIDPAGGDLKVLELLHYPVSPDRPEEPLRLFNDTSPDLFMAQSGIIGRDPAPNHYATYIPERYQYTLADGEKVLEVRMRWQSPEGIQITKTYTFARDSYLLEVGYTVENGTQIPWSGRMYGQFQRTDPPRKGGLGFIYTYTGGVLSGPEKHYEKVSFDTIAKQDLNRPVTGGWAAMIQHYFAGAWIPSQAAENHYFTKLLDGPRYVIGVVSPGHTVAPGQTERFKFSLYAGPKLQDRMEAAAPYLELTVDYGWLTIIAQPLFWLLAFIHSLMGNWGWSIVLVTVLIKLSFFHLSAIGYRSMARMRNLQPRLMALKERYGDDRVRLNQAMMELYKEEKINPLGGCLPILVQIPVFISLYWVLLESVELRHAGFILWLNDLSAYDPYFVLPILMGITMVIQQRLNPAPPDPIQAKVMMVLPFVFTFFFLFFPAGLVLYWFVNNLLSIAQQWIITRKIAPDIK